MSSKNKELTKKQALFAQYYFETGKASTAYRMAYNTTNMKFETIWCEASKLLSSPKVATRIEELKEKARRETEDMRAVCMQILSDIANQKTSDLYYEDPTTGRLRIRTPKEFMERTDRAVRVVENDNGKVKYTLESRTEAIKELARLNAWYPVEKKDVSVKVNNDGNSINIGFGEDEE